MTEEMESEGKTVAEAVENALKQWGLPREQVEVQILQEASSGILGFGAKPARVKITRKHWGTPTPSQDRPQQRAGRRDSRPGGTGGTSDTAGAGRRDSRPGGPSRDRGGPAHSRPAHAPRPPAQPERRHQAPAREGTPGEPRRAPRPEPAHQPAADAASQPPAVPADPAKACAATEEILKELLTLMLFDDASISTRWDAEQERAKANVRSADSERLIGLDGKVLESLQFLMTLMVSRRVGTPVAVQVDTNDYWQKKENEILSQALKGIENVRNTGKPYRLQPMEAPMRRLIHKSLANHPDIMTSSEGDGPWRKIVLRPKK